MKNKLTEDERTKLYNEIFDYLSYQGNRENLLSKMAETSFGLLYKHHIIFCEYRYNSINEKYSKIKYKNGEKILQIAFNANLNKLDAINMFVINLFEDGRVKFGSFGDNALFGKQFQKINISHEIAEELNFELLTKMQRYVKNKKYKTKQQNQSFER